MKTVFLHIVDGTREECHQLGITLKEIDMEGYQFIIGARPIEAFTKEDIRKFVKQLTELVGEEDE